MTPSYSKADMEPLNTSPTPNDQAINESLKISEKIT